MTAGVMQLGINSDRTVQVPPLNKVGDAGWYKYSPLPGEVGPSIILGHINSAQYGPGVFVRLGEMRRGDLITIVRADHKTAVFRADQIAEYPKSRFPTRAVYGNTDGAKIRLITCGGKFNSSTRSYLDSIVVYGTLVSLLTT
ncbi:MAG: sortase [Actinomycetota bacterium]|nr:sortase [Actinomycetota bacterium]